MAKNVTSYMLKVNSKLEKGLKKGKKSTPFTEAVKRYKRNKLAVIGLAVVVIFIIVAIFAELIAPYGYDENDYTAILQAPSWKHLMGTDDYGRDIFSRIVIASRYSLPVGFICVILGLAFGGGLGLLAGAGSERVENIIMRIMDIFQAVPATLMSIAIVAALGNTMSNLILAILVASFPGFARTTRAAIFTVKDNEYIRAAQALGASKARLMLRHMVPNGMGTIIVHATSTMASSIMIISGMSYLGLGIVPPTPEWGSILNAGRPFMLTAPWYTIFPGIMILITVLVLNMMGDGLRDALDPKLK